MANDVINSVRIHADEGRINAVQDFMAGREKRPGDDKPQTFDFNRLIPMPEEIAQAECRYPDMRRPEERSRLRRLYGVDNWRAWSWMYWGTNRNAHKDTLTCDGFVFYTAWRTPAPVFIALSQRFPGLRFTVEYADQDIGHNCGVMEYLDGQIVWRYDREGDKPFARLVWADDPDDASETRAAA